LVLLPIMLQICTSRDLWRMPLKLKFLLQLKINSKARKLWRKRGPLFPNKIVGLSHDFLALNSLNKYKHTKGVEMTQCTQGWGRESRLPQLRRAAFEPELFVCALCILAVQIHIVCFDRLCLRSFLTVLNTFMVQVLSSWWIQRPWLVWREQLRFDMGNIYTVGPNEALIVSGRCARKS